MPPPSLSDPWLTSRKFAIVIDAGSSGSRLQIYSWKDARVVRQTASKPEDLHTLPAVEKGTKGADDWQIKAEPGISSFGADPNGVGKYLEPLIAHAKDQIPPSLHKSTPIFLLATAGMRLLPESQQHAVLNSACEYIYQHSKFTFDGVTPDSGRCGRSIRIISGEEEGLFGWIAVNYLMNGFAPTHQDHGRPTTYGFLDMGGASTQIAFEPSPKQPDIHTPPDENLADVRLRLLNGEEIRHQVFVTTWLGFGTNQARSRYLKQAVADWLKAHHHSTTTSPITHHAKHSTTSTISSIQIHDPCLPKDLELHTNHHDPPTDPKALASDGDVIPVVVTGTGSFTECLAKTSPLLNKDAPCVREPCLFGGVHVPTIDFTHHRFIGISEYWYSSQHVFGLGGAFDFEKYEAAAEAFCGTQWESLLDKHLHAGDSATSGTVVERSRLEMQCFKAAWIVNVLGQGMGIPRTSAGWRAADGDGEEKVDAKKAHQLGLDGAGVPNAIFQSIDTIRGTAISWTLGKMVLEASKGIPPMRGKGAQPITDPLGPVPAPPSSKPGFSLEAIEQHLPSPLRRESLGFSAVVVLFYLVVGLVLLGIASRFRLLQWRTTFRKWRRGSMKRDRDVFASESGVSGSADSSRPPSPVSSATGQVQKLMSTLTRLLPTPSRPSTTSTTTPRRTGTLTPVGGLTISTGRPVPKYSYTMPSPASPSWATLQPRDSEDDPTAPTPSGLNPNGLTVLSLSRNSSQINLTRTLPTPRNVSGFSTPGATTQSGFRSPSIYADDV